MTSSRRERYDSGNGKAPPERGEESLARFEMRGWMNEPGHSRASVVRGAVVAGKREMSHCHSIGCAQAQPSDR